MTTDELAELFLTVLYDLAEATPHPYFMFSMNDFVPTFGVEDAPQLRRALDQLSERNLLFLASFDWGGISAMITAEGSTFVEGGGETGIIERYRKDPVSFKVMEPQPSAPSMPTRATAQSAQTSPAPSVTPEYAIRAILPAVEVILERDISLSPSVREDLLADIEALKLQLARGAKNKAAIMPLLDSLSEVPLIIPLVAELKRLVSEYVP